MVDSLGDRMKNFYEDSYRYYLPRKTYTIIKCDGKAFHTYTKGLVKPFDQGLIEDMDATAIYLCQEIMGAKLAYVQSDEISIIITDFDDIGTQAWFGNNLQKMVSVAASMATSKFNELRLLRKCSTHLIDENGESYKSLGQSEILKMKFAEFDARVFQIPQKVEVENYLIWRQQDATRNSISSVAQSLYSHKELSKKSSDEQQELIFQKGQNWNDYPVGQKRGRIIEKIQFVNGVDVRTIPHQEICLGLMRGNKQIGPADVVRNKWTVVEPPVFTQDKRFLSLRIPNNN